MKIVFASLAVAFVLTAATTPASADCTCRAPGIVAKHGQIVCLNTPQGPRLARCGMVLNNASWKFLPDACPEALRVIPREVDVAMSAAPAGALPLR
jgi:hypothetical protein